MGQTEIKEKKYTILPHGADWDKGKEIYHSAHRTEWYKEKKYTIPPIGETEIRKNYTILPHGPDRGTKRLYEINGPETMIQLT